MPSTGEARSELPRAKRPVRRRRLDRLAAPDPLEPILALGRAATRDRRSCSALARQRSSLHGAGAGERPRVARRTSASFATSVSQHGAPSGCDASSTSTNAASATHQSRARAATARARARARAKVAAPPARGRAAARASAAAEAAKVLTAEPDPERARRPHRRRLRHGHGERFAGGVTASAGTAKTRRARYGRGAQPASPGTQRKPPRWSPAAGRRRSIAREAPSTHRRQLEQLRLPAGSRRRGRSTRAVVPIAVTVGADGRPQSVNVLQDPGTASAGWRGAAPSRKALSRRRWTAAGNPIAQTTIFSCASPLTSWRQGAPRFLRRSALECAARSR